MNGHVYPLSNITDIHDHDVLCGRGNNINSHRGNQFFRKLVKQIRVEYVATPKQEKADFAKLVVHAIRNLNPPGRFLIKDDNTDAFYYDIGDRKAVDKTRQALREGAPEIEKQIENGTKNPRTGPAEVLIARESRQLYGQQYPNRSNGTNFSPSFESNAIREFCHYQQNLPNFHMQLLQRQDGHAIGFNPTTTNINGMPLNAQCMVQPRMNSTLNTTHPFYKPDARTGDVGCEDFLPTAEGSSTIHDGCGQEDFLPSKEDGKEDFLPNNEDGKEEFLPSMPDVSSSSMNGQQEHFLPSNVKKQEPFTSSLSDYQEPYLPPDANDKITFGRSRSEVFGRGTAPGVRPMVSFTSSAAGGSSRSLGESNLGSMRMLPTGDLPLNESLSNGVLTAANTGGNDSSRTSTNFGVADFPNQDRRRVSFIDNNAKSSGMDWQKRNSIYLSELEQHGKAERRRSSVKMLTFIKTLQALDDEDSDDEDTDKKSDQFPVESVNHQQRQPRESISMESLNNSFRTSLNLNDLFEGGAGNTNRRLSRSSTRMSLCSRRSTRMSLVLRQSFLSSSSEIDNPDGENDDSDSKIPARHIPDVFSSRVDRRRSTITQSTQQLLSTVFGDDAERISRSNSERESILLRSAIEPVMADELMMELGSSAEIFDESQELTGMSESQQNINKFVDAGVRLERRRIMAEFRMDSIASAGFEGEADDSSSDLDPSFMGSSMGMDLSASLTSNLRAETQNCQNE